MALVVVVVAQVLQHAVVGAATAATTKHAVVEAPVRQTRHKRRERVAATRAVVVFAFVVIVVAVAVDYVTSKRGDECQKIKGTSDRGALHILIHLRQGAQPKPPGVRALRAL